MEFVVFLLLAAAAFTVWRLIKRVYLGAQMRRLTRIGDPMIMDLHERQMSMDWYSLDPNVRVAMALDFQRDPARVYADFASGGADLQPLDFFVMMRRLIATDPACAHLPRGDVAD